MTLRDAVYGAAVGDALGVPYEFMPRGSFECEGMTGYGTHRQPAGTWSDDTSMLLATCDSYRELGKVDCADIRRRFEDWCRLGRYSCDGDVFDIGGTTATALSLGRGLDGERDNGNGSLMRIAPLAYFGADASKVGEVSAITHAHQVSKAACVELVRALRQIRSGRPLKAPDGPPTRSGGYVLDTLQSALWCLLSTRSYRDCVLAAVNLGDDTDTTACVAGALAGEMYGFGAIPSEWVGALRGRDLIERCVDGIGRLEAA